MNFIDSVNKVVDNSQRRIPQASRSLIALRVEGSATRCDKHLSIQPNKKQSQFFMFTKFLLIDDDREDISFFEDSLKRTNPSAELKIIDASSEFMELIQAPGFHLPEIIFLDINLPGADGWDCLERIKRIDPWKKIPTILWSDTFLVQDRRRAFSSGALAAFEKPDNVEMLDQFLKSISSSDHATISRQLIKLKDSGAHGIYLPGKID
jgi:CheY-like chemotaxis protein